MKTRVPVLIKDLMATRFYGVAPAENVDIGREEFFLDGPVTRRVAVLDFDAVTGELHAGARFLTPKTPQGLGAYEIRQPNDYLARDFNQVSVFGTVMKTLYMFEDPDTLGRRVQWAFEAPQLLIVPRASEWANAFYERESHSLQFFYFPHPGQPEQLIYTSLSQDIVAHETGHAILDGIAPDLYNAVTPQALAVHEAIADLTAVMIAFRSRNLRRAILEQTGGSIERSTAFSGIAEEFATALSAGGRDYLRELHSFQTLVPGDVNEVARDEPHALSVVLSSALYSVMVKIHATLTQEEVAAGKRSGLAAAGRALGLGAERFKRMIFPAHDYLPPGNVSFGDYGRAIIAADQASHPDDGQERAWIREEFLRRQIVSDAAELEVETDFEHPALKEVDLRTIVESDWAAYDFANRNRDLLRIPAGIPFRVRPRLDVEKRYYHQDGPKTVRECLFKVSWDQEEPNPDGRLLPARRQITVGTTLAVDWATRRVRARLTTDRDDRQVQDRDAFLQRLADEGILRIGRQALGPDGRWLQSAVRAEVNNGLMRVHGTARMLHII